MSRVKVEKASTNTKGNIEGLSSQIERLNLKWRRSKVLELNGLRLIYLPSNLCESAKIIV
jgi:hypothetical protein